MLLIMMVTCMIIMKTTASFAGGHLVSHIKVGETYHQRKEGVTTTQWYLFNDFSISDVEKVGLSSLIDSI